MFRPKLKLLTLSLLSLLVGLPHIAYSAPADQSLKTTQKATKKNKKSKKTLAEINPSAEANQDSILIYKDGANPLDDLVLTSAIDALQQNQIPFEVFKVSDIRLEGLQRIEVGTVFNYLPIQVGENLTQESMVKAMKSLYATGLFKDIKFEREENTLVVALEERPAIGLLSIKGGKEFTEKQIKDALKNIGIAESRIFDRAMLERAQQEIKKQYYNLGKYNLQIETTITPIERNRVAIRFDLNEGSIATIKQINLIGNKTFTDKQILENFSSSTGSWFDWYTKENQYSKQKFSADLESIKSFYMNQGYLEFKIDSSQVSISPDKKEIYLSVSLHEGDKFKVGDIKFAGNLIIPEADLQKLVTIKKGDVFNREALVELNKIVGDRLSNEGYAFVNVNAIPEVDQANKEVSFTFLIDPGVKTYVRRVNFSGNYKTRDEVLRREMRQLEGAWYSSSKINRGRERLDRLGYFADVTVDTVPVAGSSNQVDVNYNVNEKPTGNVMLSAGVSSSEGLVLGGAFSQSNVFGSGNSLGIQMNSGKINKVYALSFTDPYFTVDGVSRGFDLYHRNVDSTSLTVGQYRSSTQGVGVRFGIPLTETDYFNTGLAYERTSLSVSPDGPQRYIDFINQFGANNTTILLNASWARDNRDSLMYPTKGSLYRWYAEAGLPGGTIKYYKLSYQQQWFKPLNKLYTLMLNGEIGLGGGYANRPLPFYKAYYAGGIGSIRGFEYGSLGPKDAVSGEALGGTRRFVGNAELFFPFPGMTKDKSVRMSAFVDMGSVFGADEKFSMQNMRYSTGLAVNWFSPLGPMRFSIAKPLNQKPDDKPQAFQFTLGTAF